jgi:hypothetical protein
LFSYHSLVHLMPVLCAESFDRELTCTESQWAGWLRNALSSHPHQLVARAASVRLGGGELTLSWQEAGVWPALTSRVPRLVVSFRFHGVDPAHRYLFARRFDALKPRHGM